MDLLSDVSLEPIEAKNVAALDGMRSSFVVSERGTTTDSLGALKEDRGRKRDK